MTAPRRSLRALLAPVVACAVVAALAVPAHADTLYVGRPQPWLRHQDTFQEGASYDTATEALAAAADGDRVIVLDDLREPLVVDKRIELLGYGNKARPMVHAPITVRASGVVVDNLHFRTLDGTAITAQGAHDLVVSRCFFTECRDTLMLQDGRRARVLDNQALFAGALRFFGGGEHLVRGNQIESGSIYAVRFAGSPDNRFEANHVRRAGWVGLVAYSRSDRTVIEGNVFEGCDIGLSLQTDDNIVRDNLFARTRRGLALTRSPFGKDGSEYDDLVYVDSDTGDVNVVISGNRIEGNTFLDCRREAALLKQGRDNTLVDNVVRGSGLRGLVLMEGSDGNRVEGWRVAGAVEEAVRVVRSTGNTISGPEGGGLVRLLEAPGNTVEGLRAVTVGRADRQALQPPPDGDGLLAFGDFHTHSLLSDGASTPEELLGYARDVAGLDFVAMSDHGEYVGHPDGRWAALEAAVAGASVPGRFLALPGYETTFVIGWSGHFNVYFAGPGGVPYMAPHGGRTWIPDLMTPTPERLLEKLRAVEQDTLVIRHHYFATPDFWQESPVEDDLLPMTELCSVHAIWSGQRDIDAYASDRSAEIRGHVSTLEGALASGRVLGVGGSSDSHYTFPGDSGLTGVVLDELGPGALFEALRARRTYATTGARIRLSFSVDGRPMGSVLTGAGTPSGELFVEGTADLEEVTIYESGRVLERVRPDGRTARVTFTADGPPPDGSWYMARVRQVDGEAAWTSPVFVRPVAPDVVSEDVILDRERMVLLAYAAVLRAWPELPTKDLGGLSPKVARTDPVQGPRFEEAWARYLRTVEELERQALALGLTSPPDAQRIIREYALRFGPLPPPIRIRPAVDPLVDLSVVRQRLGLPGDG